jgi:hypothetical protein
MKLITTISAGILGLLGLVAFAAEGAAVLGSYEKVAQALVADDLSAAQKAANDLAGKAEPASALSKHAAELSKSNSLQAARDHFKAVSGEAVSLAKGQEGWNVMSCPMVKSGDWVQRGDKVANPYMGQKMPGCGGLKKDRSAQNSGGGCCSTMMRS